MIALRAQLTWSCAWRFMASYLGVTERASCPLTARKGRHILRRHERIVLGLFYASYLFDIDRVSDTYSWTSDTYSAYTVAGETCR